MNGIFDGYTVREGRNLWFAGANTAAGFTGSYPSIADERQLKRVYILKGGPGTGKSTLIREIGQAAEQAGFPVESFLCGSDPDSLDCAVLDGRIAVLDGTPPHPWEMQYPGAASELIDVSRFWDSEILSVQRERIAYHASEKAAEYASAYRWIGAAEQAEREIYALAKSVFLYEKAAAFLTRFLRKLDKPEGIPASRKARWSHGITMRGRVAVSSLYDGAQMHFAVADALGTAPIFMELLADSLERAGYSILVTHLPLSGRIAGIGIPKLGISVTVGKPQEGDRILNLARFTESEVPEGLRGRIRLAQKCCESCLCAAEESLKRAAVHHFTLEEIYKPAMDFDELRRYAEGIRKEILQKLRKKSE